MLHTLEDRAASAPQPPHAARINGMTDVRPASPAAGPGATQHASGATGWLGLALTLVDEIECPLIVCDAQGRIQFANQAAQQDLARPHLLGSVQGVVRPLPGVSGDFDTAVRLAAERGKRTLVRLARGEERLLASVLPLRGAGEAPRVLVVLGRRQACSELGLEMLASSYGLTYAERRVLAALLREASPREIAHDHCVAISTVRTQISSIRAKLGTRSIDGLLLRAAEVPPVAGALRLGGGFEAVMRAAA